MSLLFVYGTLKKGGRLSGVLEKDTYIGPTVTTESKFDLIGGSAFPFLVREQKGYYIKGDLYDISDNTLTKLDWVEGAYGENPLYTREKILVKTSDNVDEEAWVYVSARKNGGNVVGIKLNTQTYEKEWNHENN